MAITKKRSELLVYLRDPGQKAPLTRVWTDGHCIITIDGNAAVSVDRHDRGRMYGKSKIGACLAIRTKGIILDDQQQREPTNAALGLCTEAGLRCSNKWKRSTACHTAGLL
jgi:hypothetical protein